jgi:hypothetical protein
MEREKQRAEKTYLMKPIRIVPANEKRHERAIIATYMDVLVFPQCQNSLNNNKFTSFINFIGFNLPNANDFT